MRRLRTQDARPGQRVGRTVYDIEGHVLLREETPLTPALVALLRRHDVRGLWVEDDVVPGLAVEETVRHEARERTKVALAGAMSHLVAGRSLGRETLLQLTGSVRNLVAEVSEADLLPLSLSHLRPWDDYAVEQPIQVLMVAAAIGHLLHLGPGPLFRLGLGGALHDIGMLAVPREILDRPGPLTDEERQKVRAHARLGWEWAHSRMTIPPTASITLLQHHERMDGSGYPRGLRGDAIYILSRIVAVADAFVAMRTDRPHRPRLGPRALWRAFREDPGGFDRAVVEALFGAVALAPDGEIVRLSDGSLAAVLSQTPGRPLQPRVIVVGTASDIPVAQRHVDLAPTGVVVEEILDDWPEPFMDRVRRLRGPR